MFIWSLLITEKLAFCKEGALCYKKHRAVNYDLTVIINCQSTFLLIQLMHTIIKSQPVVQACGVPHACTICRHDIDHVINDEHNRTIIVVLVKQEIAP